MRVMHCDSTQFSDLAWTFLNSEFVREPYASQPIERRLDAFLRHHQLRDVLNDGTAYDGLLHSVMASIGPALRSGILEFHASHVDHGVSSARTESWST